MDIIRQRHTERIKSFSRSITYIVPEGARFSGAGVSVDCDENGIVDLAALQITAPAGYENYMEHLNALPHSSSEELSGLTPGVWRLDKVQYDIDPNDRREYVPILCTGEWVCLKVRDEGVTDYSRNYTHAAVGKCDCGEEVILDSFTNTCSCNRDYNMSGQLLSPREFWGEECNETAEDILRGGDMFDGD